MAGMAADETHGEDVVFFKRMAVAGVLLAAAQAHGQQAVPADAFNCVQVQNDIARLECYDEAFAEHSAAAQNPGNWSVHSSVNPLDDTLTTLLTLEETPAGSRGLRLHRHTLGIRCTGDRLVVLINWPGVAMRENQLVTSRVGSAPATSAQWLTGQPRSLTFYPGDAEALVMDMLREQRFVAQLNATATGKKTAIFNINGLSEAAKPMRGSCLPIEGAELPAEGSELPIEWTEAERELINRAVEWGRRRE